MKLLIDTDVLTKDKLEVQQYVWLYMQFIGDIDNSWIIAPLFKDDLNYLEKEHFIKILATPNGANPKVALRDRTYSLFEVDQIEAKFNTFWSHFPMKVPDGNGGYRPLRTKEIGTKDYEEARKKYTSLIRFTPGLHEKILKGLDNQLISQKHKLQYMNHIIAWLNQRIWERFADMDISDTGEKVTGI
tara:strand:- start:32025 stop:32585 length:561 start_codon:yes stop_codon:yes gene_type:complete